MLLIVLLMLLVQQSPTMPFFRGWRTIRSTLKASSLDCMWSTRLSHCMGYPAVARRQAWSMDLKESSIWQCFQFFRVYSQLYNLWAVVAEQYKRRCEIPFLTFRHGTAVYNLWFHIVILIYWHDHGQTELNFQGCLHSHCTVNERKNNLLFIALIKCCP